MTSSCKRTRDELVSGFDFTMKKDFEEWPRIWKEFKLEQNTRIAALLKTAETAAREGQYTCGIADVRYIAYRGDTIQLLSNMGFSFEPNKNSLDWEFATEGRARELKELADHEQSPKEIRDLKWAIVDSMGNRTSQGPIRVRIRTSLGKSVLEEILRKYPLLQLLKQDEDGYHTILIRAELDSDAADTTVLSK